MCNRYTIRPFRIAPESNRPFCYKADEVPLNYATANFYGREQASTATVRVLLLHHAPLSRDARTCTWTPRSISEVTVNYATPNF